MKKMNNSHKKNISIILAFMILGILQAGIENISQRIIWVLFWGFLFIFAQIMDDKQK